MEMDVEDYVLQSLGEPRQASQSIDLPLQVSTISTEIKSLMDKLREIEIQLSQRITQQSTHHSQNQSCTQGSSDFDILEEFHQVQNQIDFRHCQQWSSTNMDKQLKENLDNLTRIQTRLVSEEVDVWKREMQLAQNGFKAFTKNLSEIQEICEQLLDAHWLFRFIIKHSNEQTLRSSHSAKQNEFLELSNNLLKSLLNATFVVEHQPPQVMKLTTKFPQQVQLRFLLGPKLSSTLSDFPNLPIHVKANVISEPQAKDILTTSKSHTKNQLTKSGDLSDSTTKLEIKKISENKSECVIKFSNLQLKNIIRRIKKVKGQPKSTTLNYKAKPVSTRNKSYLSVSPFRRNSQTAQSSAATVTDEKFCLHFQMELKLGDLTFNVTHGIQESHGWATVTWDNAFSPSISRVPFEVPCQVPWECLAETINMKFESLTHRALDSRQLDFLKSKLISNSQSNGLQHMVSYSKFCKELIRGTTLSFWEWFYHTAQLIKKHALSYWQNGSIYGFVGREEAELLLNGYPVGTFLLRFSDSVLGGISICYVAKNGLPYSISPLTSKNLTFRSLIDSIWDLENLSFLYPNIPKSQAFPKPKMTDQSGGFPHYVTSFPKMSLPVEYS